MSSRLRFRGPLDGFHMGRLTLTMLVIWLVTWILAHTVSALVSPLSFLAPRVVPGWELWRLATYSLVIEMEPAWFVLTLVIAVLLMPTFEARWGPWGLLRFFALTSLAGSLGALAVSAFAGELIFNGATAFLDGLIVAYTMIFPGAQFRAYFVLPISTRTMIWLILIINALGLVYYVPKGVLDPVAGLAGMGVAWVYLKHGWRLGRWRPLGGMRDAWNRIRLTHRRRRMRVVDRDFDKWLDMNDKDEPKH